MIAIPTPGREIPPDPVVRGRRVTLARFPSKIVGISHYTGWRDALGRRVRFVREPENPHDENAIAAFNGRGARIGYLPREEAKWLAPLLDDGFVRLGGLAESLSEDQALGVTLIARAPPEFIADILASDMKDDYTAILHNFVAPLVKSRAAYSEVTLRMTVEGVRRIFEHESLWPKTRLLLRAVEGELERRERTRSKQCRAILRNFLACVRIGAPRGWAELAIAPLWPGDAKDEIPEPARPSLPCMDSDKDAVLEQILDACPYAEGARGYVIFQRDGPIVLHWFERVEYARVNWLPALLHQWRGLSRAQFGETAPRRPDPEDWRGPLAKALCGGGAVYELQYLCEPGEIEYYEVHAPPWRGKAQIQNGKLLRLLLPADDTGVFAP